MILRGGQCYGGLRIGEDSFEYPQLPVSHDLAKVFLGLEEGGRQPPQDHLAVLPVCDAVRADANSGVRTLDDVGRPEAAHQRWRQAQAIDSKALLKPFQEAGGSRWIRHRVGAGDQLSERKVV